MFKLVVLFAFVAVVRSAPAPGFLHGAPVVYPLATSHSSRIDYHSKPIVTYAAPALYHAPLVHAPVLHAPIIKQIIAAPAYYPSAVSHSSRYDVHSAPIVTSVHGYGGYGLGHGLGHGLGYGGHGLGYGGYGHGNGYLSGHY